MTTIDKRAHEAAIDHGMWLAPDDDETNYQAFVAGYLRGHSDRGVEATSARDEYEAEIASLRAKLEAVPVSEIRLAIEYARNLPEGYEERNAAEYVEYWLLRLAK